MHRGDVSVYDLLKLALASGQLTAAAEAELRLAKLVAARRDEFIDALGGYPSYVVHAEGRAVCRIVFCPGECKVVTL